MDKTVFVGLSGGVDSAVSAYLLQQQGYRVVGAHMKNWTKSIAGHDCPWQDDYQEAKRVASFLGIQFEVFDFQDQYFEKVVNYMLDEFRSGSTPNPDVMCNQEIKFKLFLDQAMVAGADLIATGHYAKTKDGQLFVAKDGNKDQTYFLYRLESSALRHTLFPLGDLTKDEVRKIAAEANLPNAKRNESMGICFVGKVGIRDFLKEYVQVQPGDIIDDHGQVIGQHEGSIFYTIGQRHGLGVGGGLPYYVTGKNMAKNEVYVTKNITSRLLWSDRMNLTSLHWINQPPGVDQEYMIRTRHRADLVPAELTELSENRAVLTSKEPIKALTPGQSTVIYDNDRVVGGGLVL